MSAPASINERTRLIGIMDGYLDALARHDFRDVRFAPHLRNTENGVVLPVGSGLARTLRSLHEGRQYFVDVHAGQVEYWGAFDEMGTEAIIGVRLKVEGSLISEVETLGVRNTDPYFFPQVVCDADGGFHDVVLEAERATKEELVEYANRYFDAIEQSDGSIVPVSDDCLRLVNGAEDTLTDVSTFRASDAHRAMTVRRQITEKHYAYIEALRARRYPIVDLERGLVVAHVLFDHPGDYVKPDGTKPFTSPNTMLAFEAFKVRAGKIVAVWAVVYGTTYGSDSGWGNGEPRRIRRLPCDAE